jgi:tetratricopeptide (TPR) repeat protein
VYSALGDMYQKANRLPDAIQATQKAIELAPENWVNYLNLALLLQRSGRVADAMAEAQNAYNLAPADARQRVVEVIGQLQQTPPRTSP